MSQPEVTLPVLTSDVLSCLRTLSELTSRALAHPWDAALRSLLRTAEFEAQEVGGLSDELSQSIKGTFDGTASLSDLVLCDESGQCSAATNEELGHERSRLYDAALNLIVIHRRRLE